MSRETQCAHVFKRWMYRLPVILVVVVSLACEQTYPVPADDLRAPVAFISHPDAGSVVSQSEQELMVHDLSTGSQWQLTQDGHLDTNPVWSPSGTHLFFVSSRIVNSGEYPWGMTGQGLGFFTFELHTGTVHPVDLHWARASGPAAPDSAASVRWIEGMGAWSPVDSTKIVAVVMVDGPKPGAPFHPRERRLVLFDMEEETARLLTPYANQSASGSLRWSCDGRYLAIESISGSSAFNVVNVQTGETLDVRPPPGIYPEAETHGAQGWTTEGRLVVVSRSNEQRRARIYLVDISTNEWTEFMRIERSVWGAHPVPSGLQEQASMIVLQRLKKDHEPGYLPHEIALYPTPKSEPVPITHGGHYAGSLAPYHAECGQDQAMGSE